MVDAPKAPLLATVSGVEIASVGYWNLSNADDWHPSAEELAAAVAAVECPAVRRPALKFGHTGEPGQGDPSIGLVDDLRLTEDGHTLVGDFVGVPAWMASADSEGRSVIASAYPDRSGEFQRDYICQLGHTHPFVVHAVALLGVMRPGIGTLESLYDLYANAPQEDPIMANAAIALAGTTTDQIRAAYYEKVGSCWDLWIREMFVDPPELIIQNDANDTLQRVPYTVSGDGNVEFGDPQSIKVQYVDARAKVEKPTVAFASRAEARPQIPSAAEAEDNRKEGAMPTLKEGLVQKLGIAADADDDTVLAAVDEALAERAESAPPAAPVVEPTAEQVAAAAERNGLVLVDQAQYAQTVAAASAGAEARAQQLREGDERIVDAAIREGRIAPARRDHWLASLNLDREGSATALASLAPGLIPLAEAGHGVSSEITNQDDAIYASLFGKDA